MTVVTEKDLLKLKSYLCEHWETGDSLYQKLLMLAYTC